VPKLTTRRLPNQKETTGPYLSCKLTRNSCKLPLFTISGRLPSFSSVGVIPGIPAACLEAYQLLSFSESPSEADKGKQRKGG